MAAVWGERRNCAWADIFPIVDKVVQSEVCPLFFALGTGDSLARNFETAGFTAVETRRLSVVLDFANEADLLAALRPGVDGLVLREGSTRSTFLPSVWKGMPSPERFLEELKRKAGLPRDYWSTTLRFDRYTVEEFASPARGSGE